MEGVVLSREQQRNIMNALYEFVTRTAVNSENVSPAEIKALPEMTKLLIWYWPTLES